MIYMHPLLFLEQWAPKRFILYRCSERWWDQKEKGHINAFKFDPPGNISVPGGWVWCSRKSWNEGQNLKELLQNSLKAHMHPLLFLEQWAPKRFILYRCSERWWDQKEKGHINAFKFDPPENISVPPPCTKMALRGWVRFWEKRTASIAARKPLSKFVLAQSKNVCQQSH